MKTDLSNLDFWDEPLPANVLRRLQRSNPVGRQVLLAPARKPVLRSRMQAMAVARSRRCNAQR